MSLPVVECSRFEMVLPSTGEVLHFRPFVVKEQKLILQAKELQDEAALSNAIEDVITACTFGKFDIKTAPVYDVEYVLLQIRAKSAGEIVDMVYGCRNVVLDENKEPKVCGTKINVKIPLHSIEVIKPEGHNNKIMLTDTVGVQMRDLPYDIYKVSQATDEASVGMEIVRHCVQSVFDADTVHTRKDFSDVELEEFLGNLQASQLAKIEQFVETTPRLEKSIELRCPSCGNQDTITLRGLDSFLM